MFDPITMTPIAVVHSPFKEKFGIPHQAGMTESLITTLELLPPVASEEVVRGLEHCSHIWLVFVFSANQNAGWRKTVRPPRLGGKQKLGVLASRSPHRPNPIGLSPVKLEHVRIEGENIYLDVSGADLMDGTPILDIKPYLPDSDALDAQYDFQSSREKLQLDVEFSAQAKKQCEDWTQLIQQPLEKQIIETIRCDPRPGYKRQNSDRVYGILLHQLNIRWRIDNDTILVDSIQQA